MDHMHNSQKGLIFILFYWKIKKLKNDILSLKYGEIRIFHHLNKKDF